jgi:hypothetical protein
VTVHGKNFVDLGFGLVKCLWNETVMTNATIMDYYTIKCDSPPLPPEADDMFYHLQISLENGLEPSENLQRFDYYVDPDITGISPWKGPLDGGTPSILRGKRFN